MSETINLWPFSERDVVGAAEAAAGLISEPEVSYSLDGKSALKDFAEGLFEGGFQEKNKLPSSLEAIQQSASTTTLNYYLDYFKTEGGKDSLRRMGFQEDINDNKLASTLFTAVAEDKLSDKSTYQDVANKSRSWYQGELARRLMSSSTADSGLSDSAVLYVNLRPDRLLAKFEQLQAYREFYRGVRQGLREEPEPLLRRGKLVLLDLYQARVNNLVAGLYPDVLHLASQISASPQTDRVIDWRKRLFAAAPAIRQVFSEEVADRRQFVDGFARRLDLVRNGAEDTNGPNFSPIAAALKELADELEIEGAGSQVVSESVFPTEVVEKLKSTRWNITQFKNFFEAVLDYYGLLSENQASWEDVENRSGPAADSKWQFIITPKPISIDTNSSKKVVTVSETFDRGLVQASPAGVLPVTAHEISHVLQAVFDEVLARQIPLAKIKGRRAVTGREMGAINEERSVYAMIGQVRPVNTTYLRALEVKLAGGTQTEVARAFMNASAKLNIQPDGGEASGDDSKKRAQSAGKNVLRLYRNGNNSSQALDYIEQELLRRSLEDFSLDALSRIAISGGSFSVKDMAALHKAGLLDLLPESNYRPARDVMKVFMEEFYPKLGVVDNY